MRKTVFFTCIIVLSILSACSNPTGNENTKSSAPVTGQAIIQSLSMKMLTPVDTSSRAFLTSGQSGYTKQEYYHPEINPGSLPDALLSLLREYVGIQAIAYNSTVELPANPGVNYTSENGSSMLIEI